MDFKKYLKEKLENNPKFKELYERKDFENLKIDIGNMVERERILNKMQQKELAKKIGTSQSYISRLENFSISPSLKTLQKIAETFGGFIDINISYKNKKEINNKNNNLSNQSLKEDMIFCDKDNSGRFLIKKELLKIKTNNKKVLIN